ncbi:MAG: hypothetical protein ACPG7F_11525 [Aggregatilineales bacterium]
MKKLSLKLTLFLIPLLILLSLPLIIGLQTTDLIPVSIMIDRQQSQANILYNPYQSSGADYCYRYETLLYRQPEVVVMGASWIQHYRADYFREDAPFYNAYILASHLEEQVAFFEDISTVYQPQTVVFHFVPGYLGYEYTQNTDRSITIDYCRDVEIRRLRAAYQHIVVNPIAAYQHFMTLHGYQQHETWQFYGSQIASLNYATFADGSLQPMRDLWLDTPRPMFDTGTITNIEYALYPPDNIQAYEQVLLKRLVQTAQQHDIELIVVIPPMRPDFYNHLMQQAGTDTYLHHISQLFERESVPFFNFLDSETHFAATVTDFRDISHSSERITLAWHLEIAASLPESFGKQVDIDAMTTLLQAAENPMQILSPDAYPVPMKERP